MATTRYMLSDVLCADDTTSHQTCPQSPIFAGKEPPSENSKVTPAGILSPKASSSSLHTAIKRTRPSFSPPKRSHPDDEEDGDYSPVASPKRRRIISARLPTPSVSRRSSMNFSSSATNATATIPRSFAEIESMLAPIADLASDEEEAVQQYQSGGFEKLPDVLRKKIFSQLDYLSLIALSQTNRLLHKCVDPQIASFEDKFSFVMYAESTFARHWPRETDEEEHPGNFACYVCFRVRAPSEFQDEQPETVCIRDDPSLPFQICSAESHSSPYCTRSSVESTELSATIDESEEKPFPTKMVTLRRYCVDCGILHGLYNPGDVITTKLDQEIWICDCYQVHSLSEMECSQCCGASPCGTKSPASP